MLKHYIKFAFRNFKANKVIFGGSLLTLCLGVLCISLLFSYVNNELSMDDFHKRKKDIYTVIIQDSPTSDWSALTPSYFFDVDYEDYSGIDEVVNVIKLNKDETSVFYGNIAYASEGIVTDSSFFKVFDFKLKVGNEKTILNQPNGLIISERLAKKIFGQQNPIGKTLEIRNKNNNLYIVQGVVSIPSNSSITFDFILPKSREYGKLGTDFILANKNIDYKTFKEEIGNIGKEHPLYAIKKTDIIALNDIYYNESKTIAADIFTRSGDKKNIYVLIIIMFVILLISALNFSNLQIIAANVCAKQNAITIISGAQKRNIVSRKIVETALLLLVSIILITIGYKLILPFFNTFTGVEILYPLWKVILINGSVIIVLMILALIYPMAIFTRIPVIRSLKKSLFLNNQVLGRRSIIVFQYALTFLLLISSIVVSRQLGLMLKKDLGFTSKNVIRAKLYYQPLYNRNLNKNQSEADDIAKQQHIYNALASHSSIANFSQGRSPINSGSIQFKANGVSEEFSNQNFLNVTPDYKKVFDLKIAEGRFFNEKMDKLNDNSGIVINEAAKILWDIENISKRRIITYGNSSKGYQIIGVVKDFNYERLTVKSKPLVMFYNNEMTSDYFIRFHNGRKKEGLKFVSELFQEINPNETFKYSFLSDEILALYKKEKRLSAIYMVFTIVALLISAIGLFTIALYDTKKRKKEIGIRKVNGATITQILSLLNKDFLGWIAISFVLAIPVSWYAMNNWLSNFAYKTTLNWWIFALAGIAVLGVALLTVSWQSFRAATANPVDSLRDE